MNIAFTYNIRHAKASLTNEQAMIEAEFDEPSTINGIKQALRKLGHTVLPIEANEDAFVKLRKYRNKIDLAFNIAEGLRGKDREAQMPAIFEMLAIPHVGSAPLAQALCLDKAKTKEILKHYGVPTPNFQLFVTGKERPQSLKFPVIVKPNLEGSSKGIFQHSVVNSQAALIKKAREVIKKYQQPALAEEMVMGREFTVAIIGNAPAEVLPPVEIDYSSLPKGYIAIDSYETKWIIDNPTSQEDSTVICPAKIDKKLWQKIQEAVVRAKEAIGILDWCRMDVRLDKNGIPNVLDINQLPGIIPNPKENSRFPLAARAAGYSYEKMLSKIIAAAVKRYGIKKA